MKHLLLSILTLVCIYSCRTNTYQEPESYSLDSYGKIQHKQLILAREDCANQNFSFCGNYRDSPRRLYPLLVELNHQNFIASYEDTIYLYASPRIKDSLESHNLDYIKFGVLQNLLDSQSTAYNHIKFSVPSKFKRKVRRSSEHRHKFDGILGYHLFKLNVDYVYGGKLTTSIPDIKQEELSLFKRKVCDVYFIFNVSSVEPIGVDDYLKSAE